MKKILKNSIQCKFCKDILISEWVHDFVTCSCGKVSVGGTDYGRWVGELENIIDLTEYEENKG